MSPAAARLTDPIAHTSTFGMLAKMAGSLIVGAVVGALATAAIMAVAGLTVLTGGAALVAFLAVGFAVSMVMEATGINEFIDKTVDSVVDSLIPKSIEGKISSGSLDVTINSLKAARAAAPPSVLDVIVCAMHSGGPPPMIAQGSDNVFINSLPAARKDDKTTCGGTIAEGSPDVTVGGGTVTVREIKDERPWWIAALGVAIGVALTLCGKGKMNLSALKSSLPCLLLNMGASIGGSMVGHAIKTNMGSPVNVITGGKVLQDDPDFYLPGVLPIRWDRFYSSHDRREGSMLGVGWGLYCEIQLVIERAASNQICALHYYDNHGRSMRFPPVQPGECHYSTAEGYYLICTELGQYIVQGLDGMYRDFGVPPEGFAGPLKLQRLEDRNGNWQAFRYDAANRLGQINDVCGRSLAIRYDAIHPERVAEITLVKGADNEQPGPLIQYCYTAKGELAAVIDHGGRTLREFTYSASLMTEHRVPHGLRCFYQWQGLGGEARVIKHWTSDGETYDFIYDLVRKETSVSDQIGRNYHWTWSEDKQPTAYTDPEGNVWRYEWDENRQLVSLVDPLGARTTCEYDEYGHITTTINALDQIESTEWHADLDLPVAETDAAGNRWSYQYDDYGNLIVITDPDGHETEQFFDKRGLPHTIRDAKGGHKHMEWNSRALMTAYVDCSGKRTQLAYNARGQLHSLVDALGNATRYKSGDMDLVTEIVRADGSSERFEYDQLGRLRLSIDSGGRATAYQRNVRGQVTERTNPLGRTVHFKYDRAHRLEHLINENGERYSFVYDNNDHVIEEIALDGVIKKIERDARGLAVALTDASGDPDAITLYMQRDALGRLTAKHARGRSTLFRYDQIGQLLQAQLYTDNGGTRTVHDDLLFEYSKRNELLSETGHMGTSRHEYDELNNRIASTLPDGRTINSLLYGSGHLHQINIDGEVVSDIERDDLHREILRSQGELATRFAYDSVHRKISQRTELNKMHEPILTKEWLYDQTGELIQTRHSRRGITDYSYDALGRIQSTVSAVQREIFSWDAASNLVDSAQIGGYIRHNRVLVFEDKRFEYDIHGRLETKRIGAHTRQSFRYDGEHRLRQVETTRNGITQLVYFEYDALGRRIRKHDDFGKTEFLWDIAHMRQEQRGNRRTTYIHESGGYAPLARIDSAVLALQDTGDSAGSQQIYYFHNDAAGLPEELTSSEGRLVWQAAYKTWGNNVLEEWTQTRGDASAHHVEQNVRFQGQYLDRETGLHYNTFRFYDPDIGRFISPDPIGLRGGINLHRYAPNPITWMDPWGWACWSTERKNYWKAEHTNNKGAYSANNQARIKEGQAPKITVEVYNFKTRQIETKDVSIELHHATIPQRTGGQGVHAASNLDKVTPWEHAAVDPYRHTGSRLIRIIKDVGSW